MTQLVVHAEDGAQRELFGFLGDVRGGGGLLLPRRAVPLEYVVLLRRDGLHKVQALQTSWFP